MTTMTGPPRAEGFRLGQLVSDKRYRSYTFQAIALLALIVFFGWLVSNAIRNPVLQQVGIDFGFLGSRAGYDINQQPIAYTSQSTHLRAAMVGAINTLIVAGLACATATLLGVVAGVLRLSSQLDRRQADGGLCRDVPQHPGADLDPHHLHDLRQRLSATERVPRRGFGVVAAVGGDRGDESRLLRAASLLYERDRRRRRHDRRNGRRDRDRRPGGDEQRQLAHRARSAGRLVLRCARGECLGRETSERDRRQATDILAQPRHLAPAGAATLFLLGLHWECQGSRGSTSRAGSWRATR